MISSHVPHDAPSNIKDKICKECKGNSSIIVNSFRFPNIDLDSYLENLDYINVNKILSTTTKENFSDIIIDEIKIGEIALYQVLLRYKQSKTNSFSDKAWNEYLKQLEISLLSFFALKKIIKEVSPDRIIQYSGLYSVNSVCRKLADINNIPSYFLHAGINQKDRLKHLIIAKSQTFDYIKSLFESWEKIYKYKTCNKEAIYDVTDNFIDIINSRSFLSYSNSKSEEFDIRKFFKIPENKKVIVAVMSSYDEHLAADAVGAYRHLISPLFHSQIEWIKCLINFFQNRDDLFLIIRLHPREFPTKREKTSAIISQHAKDVEAEFKNLPENVVINWPSDNVSFYDLIEETDLFLNAFSTSAREISMLGLPVLTYNNEDVLEPVSVNFVGGSVDEYLNQIDTLLLARFDFERIRFAYRWRALEQVYSHVSIKESYQEKDDLLSFSEKVLKKLKRIINIIYPYWLQKLDCNNRAEFLNDHNLIELLLLQNQGNISNVRSYNDSLGLTSDEELVVIKSEIKRLMKSLYNDKKDIKVGTLRSYLDTFVST
jgi:hypothetical protein